MSMNTAALAANDLAQPTPGSLPADYVETDAAQCSSAKAAHLCGIFGILGTGIYNLLKRKDARPFVRDQAAEAFNFHLMVFVAQIALSIAAAVAGAILGLLATVLSLASTAILIGVSQLPRAPRGEEAVSFAAHRALFREGVVARYFVSIL